MSIPLIRPSELLLVAVKSSPNLALMQQTLIESINIRHEEGTVIFNAVDQPEFLDANRNSSKLTPNTISKHSSSPREEDTSVQNTIPNPNPPLPIPSVDTPAPQDKWSQDKHIDLVNIIGYPGAGILTRAMAKELGWIDAMQDELNQFARNKVWTLVPAPYGKTIISSK
ncbi:hypothetical protein Tco_1028872 [Tanacetum coccineum]|uniref:Uncharacterized protein n=1 Tax=Tanacetum coccineum TaxID=301880 RepID=A0ABQ5G1T4_9ASTR